jgi:hypothetical protein
LQLFILKGVAVAGAKLEIGNLKLEAAHSIATKKASRMLALPRIIDTLTHPILYVRGNVYVEGRMGRVSGMRVTG